MSNCNLTKVTDPPMMDDLAGGLGWKKGKGQQTGPFDRGILMEYDMTRKHSKHCDIGYSGW